MRIFLRPITEHDAQTIVNWRNTEKVLSHCMTKTPITIESHLDFFHNNVQTGKYKQFIVERLEENTGVASYPIATVYLKDIDYYNKRCELCVFTSNDEEWIEESQSIAIRMLVEKAFTEYGMHKVYSYVFSNFPDEINLLKDAGFSIEAILRGEASNENEEFVDIIRLCVFNN